MSKQRIYPKERATQSEQTVAVLDSVVVGDAEDQVLFQNCTARSPR